MSRDCPVRYIITVNALKEGWDCPFAYILASLANKTSRVDVEQILGRVLRLPYTMRHADEFLNFSYVFTSSANFRETVEAVIQGLNNAGFSGKDYRVAEEAEAKPAAPIAAPAEPEIFPATDPADDDGAPQIDVDNIKKQIEQSGEEESRRVDSMLDSAKKQNERYEQETSTNNPDNDIPMDIRKDAKTYRMKDEFAAVAQTMNLPVFRKKVNCSSLLEPQESVRLDKVMLSEDFLLENVDSNIDFALTQQEIARIDLEERNQGEYVPKYFSLSQTQMHAVREAFVGYGIESKRTDLAKTIAKQLKFDEIHEPHITNYVRKVLANQDDQQIVDLFDNPLSTVRAFRQKIERLLSEHQKKTFRKWIDVGQVTCEAGYVFPKELALPGVSMGLSKGLYTEEGDMNDFEYRVAAQIANLDTVLFWHRIPARGKGFCLNGFINYYPDFLVRMKSGMTVLVETKGDDRDNSDSRDKLELGLCWANKAGEGYRYFMVFDTSRLEGSVTVAELLDRLRQL